MCRHEKIHFDYQNKQSQVIFLAEEEHIKKKFSLFLSRYRNLKRFGELEKAYCTAFLSINDHFTVLKNAQNYEMLFISS